MLDIMLGIALWGVAGAISKKQARDEKIRKMKEEKRNAYLEEMTKNFRASKELETEVEDYIRSGKNVYDIYETIEDNLLEVFGIEYPKQFMLPGIKGYPRYMSDDPQNPFYWTKHLLLSKQGKIAQNEFYSGFPISKGENKDLCIKMGRQIERNLMSNNTGLRLILKPDFSFGGAPIYNPEGSKMILDFWANTTDPEWRLW